MTTATATRKAAPNEHGVTWAVSRTGRISIAIRRKACTRNHDTWEVWALYTGTHDLVGVTREFSGPADKAEADARKYANMLWRTR